jgi:hypothetical protein
VKFKLLNLVLILAACRALPIFAATSIVSQSATPSTITFAANDPDLSPVAGNSSATITFTTSGGNIGRTWNVQVQATTVNFGSCPNTIAPSVVHVSCGSAGGGNSASCSAPFYLSNALQTIASGTEGSGPASYTVIVNFTFADSWTYIPATAPCTLNLSYQITAN